MPKTTRSRITSIDTANASRSFKTRSFSKDAVKAGISDSELCDAVRELENGQGDNLGGNVWKKRLNQNRDRAVVLTKPKDFWVFAYLFGKQDRSNIDADELLVFRKVAKDYGKGGLAGMHALMARHAVVEICHEVKNDR